MGIFGDIQRALFGGSKEKTESGNMFAENIANQFGDWGDTGGKAHMTMGNILGLGGDGARSDALSNWWDSSGGEFMLGQGLDQVDAMYRSKGLANSGAAMKGMEDYRSGLASSKMGEAMNFLGDTSRLGLGAGGIVSDAGKYSKGNASKSDGGFGKAIGAIFASEPILKTNIEKISTLPNGLGVYGYDYRDDIPDSLKALCPDGRQIGVMADEVERILPEALGPTVEGYRTVNYDKLMELL